MATNDQRGVVFSPLDVRHAGRSPVKARALAGAGLGVAVRPVLWGTALREVSAMAGSGWWRHWPPLPVPDPDYLRFRLETAYGDAEHSPPPGDIVVWLQWCRRMRAIGRLR